jgi:hypothetical protein
MLRYLVSSVKRLIHREVCRVLNRQDLYSSQNIPCFQVKQYCWADMCHLRGGEKCVNM